MTFSTCQLNHIDWIINREVTNCHPRSWDENTITDRWLTRLINEWPSIQKPAPHPTTKIFWDAYKMRGPLEAKNGDIAFLIKINFENKKELLGVGLLEAKRIYPKTLNFKSLNWPQLKKLNSNSSNHRLLLYDHDPTPIYSISYHDMCCCAPSIWSAAIVVPTRHAIAYGVKNQKLERIGYRLSEQIVLRYFRGLDLDFNNKLVDSVLKGVPSGPSFLVVATIHLGNTDPLESSWKQDPIRPDDSSDYIRILDKDNHIDG